MDRLGACQQELQAERLAAANATPLSSGRGGSSGMASISKPFPQMRSTAVSTGSISRTLSRRHGKRTIDARLWVQLLPRSGQRHCADVVAKPEQHLRHALFGRLQAH